MNEKDVNSDGTSREPGFWVGDRVTWCGMTAEVTEVWPLGDEWVVKLLLPETHYTNVVLRLPDPRKVLRHIPIWVRGDVVIEKAGGWAAVRDNEDWTDSLGISYNDPAIDILLKQNIYYRAVVKTGKPVA